MIVRALSSDGGLLLLAQLDQKLRLTQRVAACIQDRRLPERIQHSLLDLLRQRIYQNLPYWDLYAALRPVSQIAEWADGGSALGRTDITEETMRDGHRRFIAQAFEKLSDR